MSGQHLPQIELAHMEVITIATWPLMLAKLQSNRQTTCRVLGACPVPGIKPSSAMVVEKFDELGEAGLKACQYHGRSQIIQSEHAAFLVDQCGTALPLVLFGRGPALHFPRVQPRRVDQSRFREASIWQLVDLLRCVRVDHDVPCQDRGHQESEAHRVRLQRWWSLMPNCRLLQGPIGNAFEPRVLFQRVCAARC
eukprot:s1850_g4.t1